MNILIISKFYDPDPGQGQRVAEAATALADRGHTVRVFAQRQSTAGEQRISLNNGVVVERLWSPTESGFALGAKAFFALWFQLTASLRILFSRERFDILLTFSTPPMVHVLGVLLSRLKRLHYVFWCIDVHPESMIALGHLSEKSFSTRVLAAANRWALQRCDLTISVGRCMKHLLVSQGAPPEKVAIVPMWHRDALANLPNQEIVKTMQRELGTTGRFVVMYSGNFGRMHQFEGLLAAAEELRDDAGTVFLFSGTGPRLDYVRQVAAKRRLDNLIIRPPFPEEVLSEAFALASVHVISLRSRALGISVPGKLYGAMASGRPVIFVGPERSEAALTVREEECGFVVDPDDTSALLGALRQLKDNPVLAEALGCRGRDAFRKRYCQSRLCTQLSEYIESAVEVNHVKTEPSCCQHQ